MEVSVSDSWPKIKVPQFDDESDIAYAQRRDRIVEIMNDFRHRPMSPEVADRLDVQLDRLLSGAYEHDHQGIRL
jgi:hypothetical protein